MMPAHVTDHAVRRYAERALHMHVDADLEDPAALLALGDRGVDVEAVRRRLHDICDRLADRMAQVGIDWSIKADGVTVVMRGFAAVTTLPKNWHPHYYHGDVA